jgi:hypothetical protein
MPERRFNLSPYYDLDNYYRLHCGPQKTTVLLPFQEITTPDLRVGIIDNNGINPKRLLLVEKDRTPVRLYIERTNEELTFTLPGKSAFLFFERTANQGHVGGIVEKMLRGRFDRRDHLHCVGIPEIRRSGWVPFWIPLQMSGNLLHCRLVSEETLNNQRDPGIDEAIRLGQAFVKFC